MAIINSDMPTLAGATLRDLYVPIANQLPPDARDALVAASRLRNRKERAAAVQEAHEHVKQKYPHLFR